MRLLRSHARVVAPVLMGLVGALIAPSAAPASLSSVGMTVNSASVKGRTLTTELVTTRSLKVRFTVSGRRSRLGTVTKIVHKGTRTLRIRILRRTSREKRLRLTVSVTRTRPTRKASRSFTLPYRRARAPVGGTDTPPDPTPPPGGGTPTTPGTPATPDTPPTQTTPTTPTTPTPTTPDPPAGKPPVITLGAGTTAVAEGAAPTAVDAALEVEDDDAQLTGAAVRIASGADAGDVLAATTSAAITATYEAADQRLTLTGTAPLAAYRDALRSVTFSGTSDTPTADKQVTFQVADATATSATATKALTVTPVDDAPSAVDDAATIAEDSGDTTFDVRANDTDVDAGPSTVVSITQPVNGVAFITGGGTGVGYTPGPNSCNAPPGTAPDTFTYTLNGGATATVSVTVTCVDDPPTAVDDSATFGEDDPEASIDVLANDLDVDGGPKSVTAASDPPNGTTRVVGGELRYRPDPDVCGSDGFTYTVTGGSTATVTVTVTCVDDPARANDDSLGVAEDAPATAIPVLDNDGDPDGGSGPITIASAADPANGTVVLTGGAPGEHTGLTYQPDPDFCGADPFTYTIAGGDQATVTVDVLCVDDAPVADDEAVDGIGGTDLVLDDPTDGAPAVAGPRHVVTVDLLAGDTDVDSPTLTVVPGTFGTDDGGSVTIEGDGDATIRPSGASCVDRTDFFDYTVRGDTATDTGRVTITWAACVHYVSNSADGNLGTSSAPYDTLAQAEAASAPGDTVFVFTGDATSTGLGGDGYALQADERLVGEPAGLVVDPDGPGPGDPATLLAPSAGPRPTLTATDADVVSLDDANEVRGLIVDPEGAGGGIAGEAGDTGGTIADVAVRDRGTTGTRPGLELIDTAGTWSVVRSSFETTGAMGVNVQTTAAVDFDGVDIATQGARGLRVVSADLVTSSFSSIQVTGSPDGGATLEQTTGEVALGDGVGMDLSLATADSHYAALDLRNARAVTVDAAGQDTLSSTGTWVLRATGSTSLTSLALDDVTSVGSANHGVNIDGGASVRIADGSLSGVTGNAFHVTGGSGTIEYGGDILDGPGLSAHISSRSGGSVTLSGDIIDGPDAGGGIEVWAGTAGTTTFSGASKSLQTGAQPGVDLQANTGHTVAFTGGGLQIATTSATGLRAITGGTVAVTGPANRIASTTGTALRVVGATIGDAGLTFQRIASDGAVNGIVLDGTGTLGGLTVTGLDGTCTSVATCTGGAILASTADGVSLTDTRAVNLSHLLVQDAAENGIKATRVRGLDLDDVRVQGSGDDSGDSGIDLRELTGTAAWTDVRVTGSELANLRLENTTGTLASWTLDRGSFALLGTTYGGNAVLVSLSGDAVVTDARLSGLVIEQNGSARGLTVQAQGASAIERFEVASSAFDQNGLHASFEQSGTAALTFRMMDSTFARAAPAHAINVFSSSQATGGTLRGRVQGNAIGTSGGAGAGSSTGNGIRALLQGATIGRLAITGNTIRETPQGRGIDVQVLGPLTAAPGPAAEVTVSGNDVRTDATAFPLAAIYLGADAQGGGAQLARFDVFGNTVPATSTDDALGGQLVLDRVVSQAVCELRGTAGTAAAQLAATNTGLTAADSTCTVTAATLETVP